MHIPLFHFSKIDVQTILNSFAFYRTYQKLMLRYLCQEFIAKLSFPCAKNLNQSVSLKCEEITFCTKGMI